MQRLLVTLSLGNVLAAVGLTALYVFSDQQPALVLVLASGLALQGLFTVAVLGRSFGSFQRDAERLVILGSVIALLVGVSAFGYGFVQNFDAVDPEFGPMTVAVLIAAHAAATLTHLRNPVTSAAPIHQQGLDPVE